MAIAAQSEDPSAPIGALGQLRGRVLIVDGHPVNRNVCSMVCDLLGLTVEYAGNGHQALDAVQRVRFDLVLMDLHMPAMGEVEIARAIRRMPRPTCDTPIVAIAGEAGADTARLGQDIGMIDVLTTPVVASKLVEALARRLQGRAEELRSWSEAGAPTDLLRAAH